MVDTGCSSNTLRHDALVQDINYNAPTQLVGTPTGATMQSTAAALLLNSTLPKEAQQAHIYPSLAYKLLLSVGQMCNSGFAAVFTKNNVQVVDKKDVMVKGPAYLMGTRSQKSNHL